jgi:hypothetical protein
MIKYSSTGAAVVAALTLSGLPAHAGCVDPRSAAQQGLPHQSTPLAFKRPEAGNFSEKDGAGERVVGTWHVTYTAGGAPFGQALIQWHKDGTEWENIDFPVLGGNICMGSWKVVDVHHVSRYHIGWLYTNGIPSGYFTETETDEVSRDGNTYRGTNDSKIYDVDGNMVAEVPGTAVAVRISAP